MSSVDLAIKRHDIDASHFQTVYSKSESELTKKEKAFMEGRKLVLEELETLLKSIPAGGKVLDIGCGTAHLSKWIKDKGYEVHGMEPSEDMYNYATKNFPDIPIEKGISSKLPYNDNTYDLVVAFEVLRYIDAAENVKTYAEIHRVLKKGGVFFVTQVNKYSTDLYYLFYYMREGYSKLFNKIHHHCNFTTAKKEIKVVKDAGFSDVRTIGVFPGSRRFAYKFSKSIGDFYSSLYRKVFKSQRTENPFRASHKAHLIVIGKK
jgi:ubiquinone/menaquinone biosynthesis C-methylase UbiE